MQLPFEERTLPLDQIRFGRSRLLALVGGAIVGVAVRAVAPEVAAAADYPCFGPPTCAQCAGSTCSEYGCTAHDGACPGTTLNCWYTCYLGCYYRCCDWDSQAGFCSCRGLVNAPDCNPTC